MGLLDRFKKNTALPAPNTAPAVPDEPMDTLERKAKVSLAKYKAADTQAAVYLVLDHSGSMGHHYSNGHVQRLAERILALSRRVDDDGRVPVILFSSHAHTPFIVDLANYRGEVERQHRKYGMGRTNYWSGLTEALGHYRDTEVRDPALIVFQTDGEPDGEAAAEQAIANAATQNVFIVFVGFGDRFLFLERVVRKYKHVALFVAGRDPARVPDGELYDAIVRPFAYWLTH